jgi:hypothetical protein
MAKKAYVYRGALAKPPPIKMSIFDMHPSDATHPLHPATVAALLERQAALEDVLFKDCGIERGAPDAWKRLALALAERHVPAFGPDLEKKRGRPRRATDDDDLVRAVHELVAAGKSIRNAAQIVAKRRKESASGVEARYRRILADWRKADEWVTEQLRKRRGK